VASQATSPPIGRSVAPPAGWAAILAVAAAALVYYAAFIWKSSFLIGERRVFSLFDDAMVSMRYARHLARGHGLVWNVGEPPIEGFSNPLWTLVMAAAHLFPYPEDAISLAIQVLGVAILIGLIVSVNELCGRLGAQAGAARHPAPPAQGLVAMILVAFYTPLTYWTLSGMEVGLLALIATRAAVLVVAKGGLARLYGLLAAGIFVRMDFAIVAACFAVAGPFVDRPRAARHLLVGSGAVLAALALQTAGRVWYFHDPLPNTYYLKLTGYPLGLRLVRGAWTLFDTVVRSNGLLLVLPAIAVASARGGARRGLLALLLPFAAVCAYSVWVGGDAWEGVIACNRYLAVAAPFALVAAAWPIAALAGRVDRRGRLGPAPAAALALATVLAITPYRSTLFIDPPAYVRENADLTALGIAAREATLPGATVAAAAVGAIGYFSDRRIVDLLGKNDRRVARLLMRRPLRQDPARFFHPGHLKWSYPYSLGELRPDVVAQLWGSVREADPYLVDYDPVDIDVGGREVRLAVRRGSPFVRPTGAAR
jgi:hypothetical protein